MKTETKHLSRREFKFPLFILGLIVMIGGGLAGAHLGFTLYSETATMAVGFVLLILGIVIE